MLDNQTGRAGELAGKVALVTGGSSGIGLAAARVLAASGASVMICGLDPVDVNSAVADLKQSLEQENAADTAVIQQHPVAGQPVDVTDEAEVEQLVAQIIEIYGGIDIVVTAAGIQRYGSAAETAADLWDEVMSVNVKGAFLAIKHCLPAMRARGGGSVVVISSVQAFACQTGVAAYTASKGALNALTRSIALDEAEYGIRANTVCPGSVDTPMLRAAARRFSDGTETGEQSMIESWGRMHPLGRVARADEIGEVIAFLASDRASFVTGVAIPVDGGLLAAIPVVLPE